MSDFIDEKSPKAKGKRFTTYEVASIEDITPEPPEPEPEEPEDNDATESPNDEMIAAEPLNDAAALQNDEPAEKTVETEVDGVKLTITNEVPEDSKPEAEQLTLF